METSLVVMEEAAITPVELIEAVKNVLAGMAVHDVQQHHDTHAMRLVDQLLKLARCPETTKR